MALATFLFLLLGGVIGTFASTNGDPSQRGVISCNHPSACANQVIQCPRGDHQCVVNCNEIESCENATINANDCKYTQINLKWNSFSTSHIYVHHMPKTNAVFKINEEVVAADECTDLIIYTKHNEILIDCDVYPSTRSLLTYSTTQDTTADSENRTTELNDAAAANKTLLRMVTLIILVILLIVALVLCIRSRSYVNAIKRNELRGNTIANTNGNSTSHTIGKSSGSYSEEMSSSDTLTFDGYAMDGANEDIELQTADHQMYLNRMNDLLCVKSISVIST